MPAMLTIEQHVVIMQEDGGDAIGEPQVVFIEADHKKKPFLYLDA
jgi:hypothetical protein